jgi:hypothetical protein
MHEHDLDLIAALADGSASEAIDGVASEAAKARSLVDTCPVCRAEYEAQTRVIGWLAAAPSPAMTDLERAGLHRAIRSDLERAGLHRAIRSDLEGDEKPQAVPAPWWQRLGYVAAGLLVAAGLYGVLQNAGFTGGADTAAEGAAPTSTAAADLAEAPTEEVPFVAEGAGEEAGPITSTDAQPQSETLESLSLPFPELADEARAARAERDAPPTSDDDRECLARVGLDRHIVIREVEENGQTYLVVMPEEPADEAPVTFVEIPACRIVFEDL